METIETRLRRLERQNRIYRNLFILAGLALVAVLGYGAVNVPEVIRARKFEVVNERGLAVVIIQSWKHGGLISVQNNSGMITTTIAQADDGFSGSLEILGNGNKVVRLTSNIAGGGSLVTFSKEGNELVRLGANETGGLIEVLNKTEERIVQLQADEYGNGVVGAYNRKGKGRTLKPGP